MTQRVNNHSAPPRRASPRRTLLSLGVAALVAAWLPFSIMYMNAAARHAAALAASSVVPRTSLVTSSTQSQPLTTSASGASLSPVPATGTPAQATTTAAIPVSTHAS